MFPKASGFPRLTRSASMWLVLAIQFAFCVFQCDLAICGEVYSMESRPSNSDTEISSPWSDASYSASPSSNTTPSEINRGSMQLFAEPESDILGQAMGENGDSVFYEQEIPDEKIAHNDPRIKPIDSEKSEVRDFDILSLLRTPYSVYRRDESMIVYLPGDGDQFGWLSFESSNYLGSKQKSGPTANVNFHLLSGPNSVPLPPRLYDFELGFQSRRSLSNFFSYDCSANIGVYSDFEDSARDGVRFPAHAVGMFHSSPRADWVFGVDYLSRDDIKLLPVFGLCWHDPSRPSIRYEMIFPRPRVDLAISKCCRIYSAGQLGGGTWDIEFPNGGNDVMTYRDYRMVFGIEQADSKGNLSAWELGWAFGRSLEFRSQANERDFDDAFMIRFVSRH